MKAFSYLFIFILAIYTVSRFIALGMVYLYVSWIEIHGMPSQSIANYVGYSFYIIPYSFALFLFFRLFLIVKAKRITLPGWYDKWVYKLGLIITSFILLALIGTFVNMLIYPSGITGVPLGLFIKYSGIIAVFITLVCESVSIRTYINNKHTF